MLIPTESTTASFGPTTSGTSTSASLVVPDANLNTYVGSGTVTANLSSSTTQVDSIFTIGNKNTTKSSATYTMGWKGDVTATYDYLLHAVSSFDDSSNVLTLDLDFGTLNQYASAPDLKFDIFNLFDNNRIGLDLDSFSGSGDTAQLSTDLSLFTNLAAGDYKSFLASFDTSSLGDFSASYTLGLSDADFGASDSRFIYSLTLNLRGNVIEQASNVPEPGMLAPLGIGLLGLTRNRRRLR